MGCVAAFRNAGVLGLSGLCLGQVSGVEGLPMPGGGLHREKIRRAEGVLVLFQGAVEGPEAHYELVVHDDGGGLPKKELESFRLPDD